MTREIQHFKRANQMMVALTAALKAVDFLGPMAVQMVLLQFLKDEGPYRSRGHGRGGFEPMHNLAAGRSKYRPHQGARECARRRAQAN
jgi:hypothetical protein